MIYEWRVTATAGGIPCSGDVLGISEERAKIQFEEDTSDWATGPVRFTSVEKTGRVLVDISQVKGK